MSDLSHLTEAIIEILNEELTVLVKGEIYKTNEAFLNNIERFANFCLQDTHPEMYELHCFVGDAELTNYIDDLTFYAVNGGFNRKNCSIKGVARIWHNMRFC